MEIYHEYQQAQGPKTPRPIRIEQCFPTGVVRTWYGVCTECGYGAGTELGGFPGGGELKLL